MSAAAIARLKVALDDVTPAAAPSGDPGPARAG